MRERNKAFVASLKYLYKTQVGAGTCMYPFEHERANSISKTFNEYHSLHESSHKYLIVLKLTQTFVHYMYNYICTCHVHVLSYMSNDVL